MNRLALVCAIVTSSAFGQQSVVFQRDVRPVLEQSCRGCHNESNRSGGLDVTKRQALLTGGNRGPAIRPGKPAESLLMQAVRHQGKLKMPPGPKLSEDQMSKLESWIAAGAPWASAAEPDGAEVAGRPVSSHWAFQAVQRRTPPEVRNKWSRNAIDEFILQRLGREGIEPSPEAETTTLIRRVHLDLTGIPPAPAEVDAFLADEPPDAYERLVDRLLASKQYGERWARHWLDQARYADSDGGSRDEPRQIWPYRDWVIDALNSDMPFDRLVLEQIAGDLLPNATVQQKIATGFLRNSPLQIEAGTDREQYRVEAVADRVDTVGTVLLGLSMGCARCHDHKYDPISQKEYYQFFSFFNNADEYGPDIPPFAETQDLQATHAPLVAMGTPDQVQKWEAIRSQLLALYRERFEYRGGEAATRKGDPGDKIRTATIDKLKADLPKVQTALVMNERSTPRDAHILLGGDYLRRGIPVQPGVLSALHPAPQSTAHGDRLNRLALAKWLVDAKNPLLPRVIINRVWQQYFGVGLVETENDFGAKGATPSHPELLDYLADQLIDNGWSQKALHRLIVSSSVYRQSSKARPELSTRDPRNILLARQNRLRLDAEAIRDSGLAVSGLLTSEVGGPSVFPPQPAGVMETGQVKQKWNTSDGPDKYRRGLYTFRYRVTPNPTMAVFDAPNGLIACTRRARTVTPLQSLALLNDPAFHEMAQAFARRVTERPAEERLDFAFRLATARVPEPGERATLERLLAAELDSLESRTEEAAKLAGDTSGPETAAWVAVCRVLLNLDEFVTRE